MANRKCHIKREPERRDLAGMLSRQRKEKLMATMEVMRAMEDAAFERDQQQSGRHVDLAGWSALGMTRPAYLSQKPLEISGFGSPRSLNFKTA
jgi:hypothetical protein